MKKNTKRISFLLLVSLLMLLSACTVDSEDANRQAFIESLSEDEMVIAVWEQAYQQYVAGVETKAAYDLMNFEGVSIRYLTVPADGPEAYMEKVNELLYQNESIDMIHLPFGNPYQAYVDNGIAMDLSQAVPEIERIFPMLQNAYYVPATIWVFPTVLNRIELDKIGLGHIESLDREAFMAIREAYLTSTPRYYTKRRYQEEISDFHTRFQVFDLDKREVSLATDEVIDYVESLRKDIQSDRYLGLIEATESDFVISDAERVNGLNTQHLGWLSAYDISDLMFFPPVFEPDQALLTDGYIVNRFGKNKEIAIRFLRRYLEDEYQVAIYEDSYTFYPVSCKVTEKIHGLDKFTLRHDQLKNLQMQIIQNMELGIYESPSNKPHAYWLMMQGLYDRLEELVYDEDYYSREDLAVELKALEERLYLIMIEYD
jgi:hypothetical protein